jgi:hypothetical protein
VKYFILFFCILFGFSFQGLALTPIPYTGKLSIDSVNYNGMAEFHFCIVDKNSTVIWRSGQHVFTSDKVYIITGNIKVNVVNGRYFVLLGGQGMNPLPSELFLNYPELYLQVFFDNGDGKGLRTLSPDQRIYASPYALSAEYARIAKNIELSAGLSITTRITGSSRDNLLINDSNPTVNFQETDGNYSHTLTLDNGKFQISSLAPDAVGNGTHVIYPLKLDSPAAKAYAYGSEIITTANISDHAVGTGDGNNSITLSMLAPSVRADLNKTITRSMLSSDIRADLNRTITKSMLSSAIQADLNRTITNSMLSSSVQADLNRTITKSMLSSAIQADLNRTITSSMLSSDIKADLNRTITKSMLSSAIQADLNRTITKSMLSSQVQADLNATIEANQLSANIRRYFVPSISTHPQDTTINVDTNGSLSVAGSGQFLTYQWKKDGSSLAGETNATLSITDANATLHEGNYTVVVANDFGTLESNQAEVSIADPPVEILVIAGGSSSANAVNAWQRILIPAPYTAYNISSVDLFLRGSSTVYLHVYDQSANVSTNPHTRFAGLTPVATSNTKTFNHGTFTAVNFEFPAGTTLNSNPPYYIWAKYSNGTPQVQSTYDAGGTIGGRGNNPAILNVKVYGIAP